MSRLEAMLGDMLLVQLNSGVAPSEHEQAKLARIIELRVRKAPQALLRKLYGSAELEERLWTVGDHYVLQLAHIDAIKQTQLRLDEFGEPFPHLLADFNDAAVVVIANADDQRILISPVFDLKSDYAVRLAHNCAAVIAQPSVRWQTSSQDKREWRASGALYVLRMGYEVNADNVAAPFDLLLARHLAKGG